MSLSHRIGVVADPTVALGFRLAGLRPMVAESREAAAGALGDMLTDPVWGVILVQEDLMPEPEPRPPRTVTSGLPILVSFPGPGREGAVRGAEAYVAELLRQAIGYRVRLR